MRGSKIVDGSRPPTGEDITRWLSTLAEGVRAGLINAVEVPFAARAKFADRIVSKILDYLILVRLESATTDASFRAKFNVLAAQAEQLRADLLGFSGDIPSVFFTVAGRLPASTLRWLVPALGREGRKRERAKHRARAKDQYRFAFPLPAAQRTSNTITDGLYVLEFIARGLDALEVTARMLAGSGTRLAKERASKRHLEAANSLLHAIFDAQNSLHRRFPAKTPAPRLSSSAGHEIKGEPTLRLIQAVQSCVGTFDPSFRSLSKRYIYKQFRAWSAKRSASKRR